MSDSDTNVPTDASNKTLVFVSFAHADEDEYVRGPLTTLRRVCGDRYEFFLAKDVPDNEWETKIVQTMDRAKALVFFMTAKSLQSEPTITEIGLARKRNLVIIPVVLEEGCEDLSDEKQLEFRLEGKELLLAHRMSQAQMINSIVSRLPAAAVPQATPATGPVSLLEIAATSIKVPPSAEDDPGTPYAVTRLQRETIEHLLGVLEDCTARGDTATFDRAAQLLGMHLWSVLLDNDIGKRLGNDGSSSAHVELMFCTDAKVDWWPWELVYDWHQAVGGFVALDRAMTFTRRLPKARPVALKPWAGDRLCKVLFAAPRTPEKELDPTSLYEVFGVQEGHEASPVWTGKTDTHPGLVDLATRTEHSPAPNDLSDQAVKWEDVLQLLTKGDPVDVFHLVTFARLGNDGTTIELAFADKDDDDAADWVNVSALGSALAGDAEKARDPTTVAVVSFVAVNENPWRMAARLGYALAFKGVPAVIAVPYRASSDRSADFFTTFYTWLFDAEDERHLLDRVPAVLRRCHRAQQESGRSEVHPFGAPIVYVNPLQARVDRSNQLTALKPGGAGAASEALQPDHEAGPSPRGYRT